MLDEVVQAESSSSDDQDSLSSDSDDSSVEVTPEYLESLLEKARKNVALHEHQNLDSDDESSQDDIITLEKEQRPLPSLHSEALAAPFLQPDRTQLIKLRDPDIEKAEKVSNAGLAPPIPPPEVTKDGKPLTKKQKKELKKKTAGPDWFDLPAPSEAELPRMYREVEALRLRNQLDPKRFYRKDEGEGKGIKGLSQYFAIGTILPSSTPFGTASADNLPKSHRKRTLVDELVDDAEARRYAKKKFNELQTVRGAKGKNTLAAKKDLRRPKW
ncbi:hypothetical protein AX17_005031 [Amanita inopinata Kibby_2008]|nr:hypothetical protein AX17_005031 [Amanita inopinata Kibby_2008]